MGQTNLQPFFNDDDRALRRGPGLRPEDARPEVGVQDERHHVGGVLTHGAGDVLFSGGKEGYFLALEARTGALGCGAPPWGPGE